MKCQVCGAESGKYPLCRMCNAKRETGEIIKCQKCGYWHHVGQPCAIVETGNSEGHYRYEPKASLISKNEAAFFKAIKSVLADDYRLFPQINLASFINRVDNARFQNELFRNVDFLITDTQYCPKMVIEINDRSHLTRERRERDEKVKKICEEAGIPIINLWTSYGVNIEYIQNKINETLQSLPVKRIHHFDAANDNSAVENRFRPESTPSTGQQVKAKKQGCYIATCVYGAYDCPEVWTLRRYRDAVLAKTWYGRRFISAYYAVSPKVVDCFGDEKWFHKLWRSILDRKVKKLRAKGFNSAPYDDLSQ